MCAVIQSPSAALRIPRRTARIAPRPVPTAVCTPRTRGGRGRGRR